jgi:CheY-like chemotaxis protein
MDNKHGPGSVVLLVEDDQDVREAISDVLQEEGYVVAVADTGAEALAWLRKAETLPSVILLDLMMPVMDGWQFRAEQERRPEWAAIPVIVLSAVGNTRERAESIRPFGCLRKPLDIDELLAMLAKLGPSAEATQISV